MARGSLPAYLFHSMLQYAPLLKHMAQQQRGKERETVERRRAAQMQQHLRPSELGKQQCVAVIPGEAET